MHLATTLCHSKKLFQVYKLSPPWLLQENTFPTVNFHFFLYQGKNNLSPYTEKQSYLCIQGITEPTQCNGATQTFAKYERDHNPRISDELSLVD